MRDYAAIALDIEAFHRLRWLLGVAHHRANVDLCRIAREFDASALAAIAFYKAAASGSAMAPWYQEGKRAGREVAARPWSQWRAKKILRTRSGTLAVVPQALSGRTQTVRSQNFVGRAREAHAQ